MFLGEYYSLCSLRTTHPMCWLSAKGFWCKWSLIFFPFHFYPFQCRPTTQNLNKSLMNSFKQTPLSPLLLSSYSGWLCAQFLFPHRLNFFLLDGQLIFIMTQFIYFQLLSLLLKLVLIVFCCNIAPPLRNSTKTEKTPLGDLFRKIWGFGKIVFLELMFRSRTKMLESEKGPLSSSCLCLTVNTDIELCVQLRILNLLLMCHNFLSDEETVVHHYISWLVNQQLLMKWNHRKTFLTCDASAMRLLAWTSTSMQMYCCDCW